MNKEEEIEKIGNLKKYRTVIVPFSDSEVVKLNDVLEIVNQIDEDEVLEEPLGVLMIYVDYGAVYNYLATDKANDSYKIGAADTGLEVVSDSKALKVTESEAKEKYPSFRWVSLEELE